MPQREESAFDVAAGLCTETAPGAVGVGLAAASSFRQPLPLPVTPVNTLPAVTYSGLGGQHFASGGACSSAGTDYDEETLAALDAAEASFHMQKHLALKEHRHQCHYLPLEEYQQKPVKVGELDRSSLQALGISGMLSL